MLRGLPCPGGPSEPRSPSSRPLGSAPAPRHTRGPALCSQEQVWPCHGGSGIKHGLGGGRGRFPPIIFVGQRVPTGVCGRHSKGPRTHDGIVARSGQHCLGVGVAPRPQVREMRSSAPTPRPQRCSPPALHSLPQPVPCLQPGSGGSPARHLQSRASGLLQKPWPWPLGLGAQHGAAAAAPPA